MKTIIENYTPTSTPLTLPNSPGYAITPVALTFHEAEPTDILQQRWQMVLSGVAEIDLKGTQRVGWKNETAFLSVDVDAALQHVIRQFAIPVPVDTDIFINEFPNGIRPVFLVEQMAAYAALGSIFDSNVSVNAGFSVKTWQSAYYQAYTRAGAPSPFHNIFAGLNVEVEVQDIDAYLNQVNYQITLIGHIAFARFQ